jgi:hypothetical protein
MSEHDPHLPQDYLMHAITARLSSALSFLTSTNTLISTYVIASATLAPAPSGSRIIYHLRKDAFTQHTNYVISLANPSAYSVLATFDTPIKIEILIIIAIVASHHQQIAHI